MYLNFKMKLKVGSYSNSDQDIYSTMILLAKSGHKIYLMFQRILQKSKASDKFLNQHKLGYRKTNIPIRKSFILAPS